MRWIVFLVLILCISCAHDEVARGPASDAEIFRYGDHDSLKSRVKEFPPQYEQNIVRHFYFVELKDMASYYIDRDPHEFEIKVKKKNLKIKVERVLRGRYYLILEMDKSLSTGNLDFYVAGSKLRESFVLGIEPAHPDYTTIRQLKVKKTRVKLELVLKDKNGRWVETPEPPEIINDGGGEIEKLEHMGNGVWHVTLIYPEGNQLFYVSVRSCGVYFKNLFRFQYIDKR